MTNLPAEDTPDMKAVFAVIRRTVANLFGLFFLGYGLILVGYSLMFTTLFMTMESKRISQNKTEMMREVVKEVFMENFAVTVAPSSNLPRMTEKLARSIKNLFDQLPWLPILVALNAAIFLLLGFTAGRMSISAGSLLLPLLLYLFTSRMLDSDLLEAAGRISMITAMLLAVQLFCVYGGSVVGKITRDTSDQSRLY